MTLPGKGPDEIQELEGSASRLGQRWEEEGLSLSSCLCMFTPPGRSRHFNE